MKKLFFIALWSFLSLHLSAVADYKMQTIEMPDDYQGRVVCTLIEKPSAEKLKRGVLYVHGYNDYFFHDQLADSISSYGYSFYALELRKYGRSLMPHQKPFFAKSMTEYYADIDTALAVMKRNGVADVYLLGHSTGGLLVSLYAGSRRDNPSIKGVILNSPFFDFNVSKSEKFIIPILSFFSPIIGNIELNMNKSSVYAESLLKRYHGEWDYDVNLKRITGPLVSIHWISAIFKGHQQIKKGLDIPYPVWVLHSDKSFNPKAFTPLTQQSDCVLNVRSIQERGSRLGTNVLDITVPDGMHDLALSPLVARNRYYAELRKILKSPL